MGEEKVARRKGRKKEAAISHTDKEEKEETKGDEEADGPVHKKKIKFSEEGHKAVDDDEPTNKEQLKEAKQDVKEKSEAETEQNMRESKEKEKEKELQNVKDQEKEYSEEKKSDNDDKNEYEDEKDRLRKEKE